MGMIEWLFGAFRRDQPPDIKDYVEGKLEEADEWRAGEYRSIEARRARVEELSQQLTDLSNKVNNSS